MKIHRDIHDDYNIFNILPPFRLPVTGGGKSRCKDHFFRRTYEPGCRIDCLMKRSEIMPINATHRPATTP